MFVLMKIKYTHKNSFDFDLTTYLLVALLLATILVGSLKIIFF